MKRSGEAARDPPGAKAARCADGAALQGDGSPPGPPGPGGAGQPGGVAGGGALRARAPAAAAEAAEEAEAAFAGARRNRTACLALLCRQMQRIERVWGEDAELRRALLRALSSCLQSLASHEDRVLQELSSLAPKLSPEASLRHFLTICLPVERQHTRGLRDDEFLVLRPDDLQRADPPIPGPAPAAGGRRRMPLIAVLDNLRSAFNVGAIFRTAECLRVERLHLCGYTATPTEAGGGQSQTGRAAMGAEVHVPWSQNSRSSEVLQGFRDRGVPVFALETVAGAASVHAFEFPSPCVLLLGNERHGIEADLLALCTAPVRIPCHGVKNSLNVSVAFGICAYEIARQWHWDGGNNCDPKGV